MSMRKFLLWYCLLCAMGFVTLQSCKNDTALITPPPIPDQSFVEEFDSLQTSYTKGWRWINGSQPVGTTNWMQGPGTALMSAYSTKGTNAGFAYSNYLCTAGTNNGIISNWLISPAITLQNGDKIIFYTKSEMSSAGSGGTDYGCRLQLRINRSEEVIVGKGEDVGNFNSDSALIDINRNEIQNQAASPNPTAYPSGWTRFEATIRGLNAPAKGHFAFRYYLHGAGSSGAGLGIGIDSVAYVGKQ